MVGNSLIFSGVETKIRKGMTDPIEITSANALKIERKIRAKN